MTKEYLSDLSDMQNVIDNFDTHVRIHKALSAPYAFEGPKPPYDIQGAMIVQAVRTSHNIPFSGAANYLNKIEEGRA